MSEESTTKSGLLKALEFLSPFLRDHLSKDEPVIYGAFKGLSYGQAAITFGIVLDNLNEPSITIAAFAFIFPIFLVLAIFFGVMESSKSKNNNFLAVVIFYFILATLVNLVFLIVLFFQNSCLLGLAFVLSVIAIFILVGWGMRIYTAITKNS